MADSFERELAALTTRFDALATELPKKAVVASARAGANAVRRLVSSNAPARSGDLRRSIIQKPERSKTPGKAVFDVEVDPQKNYIFQKPVARSDRLKGSHAYYPASVEYGFFKRRPSGGLTFESPAADSSHGERVPGQYFMRRGALTAEAAATKAIVDTLDKEIDKLWR